MKIKKDQNKRLWWRERRGGGEGGICVWGRFLGGAVLLAGVMNKPLFKPKAHPSPSIEHENLGRMIQDPFTERDQSKNDTRPTIQLFHCFLA